MHIVLENQFEINWVQKSVEVNWAQKSVEVNWAQKSVEVNWAQKSVEVNWAQKSVEVNWAQNQFKSTELKISWNNWFCTCSRHLLIHTSYKSLLITLHFTLAIFAGHPYVFKSDL